MNGIHLGCQAYTWQMSDRYVGKLDHILDTVQTAGFTGFELETGMLGDWYDNPVRFAAALACRHIQPVAFTLALSWANSCETAAERQEADRLFHYMSHFPGALLVLAKLPGHDRSNLHRRQQKALACINALGRRAHAAGIVAGFHPNSPPGSIFRTLEDYQILMEGLAADAVGFVPDAGHIANGGMEVREVFRAFRPFIRHVHFKDLNRAGAWTAMGAGIIDFPGLVSDLRATGFTGWIMVEEESAQAKLDPDTVTLANGRYMHEKILPLFAPVTSHGNQQERLYEHTK